MQEMKNEIKEVTAEKLAERQREIGVAEFFARNRHLLGFDNKRKALLMAVKEAVDNALDACEEAHILPEVSVETIDMQNERFRVIVEDNGPGIVKKQVPNIFAKLLYGSKFHTLKQSRGQQGIGISAAALYGQLTTGRPIKIITKTSPEKSAYYCELHIDTKNNKPEILRDEEKEWKKGRGTRIELDIEANYQKGPQSVDQYLKETAIVNPHVTIIYTTPKAEQFVFPRATEQMPKEPLEIKPHPYGIELGVMLKMIKSTECRTLQSFLTQEFSRVGPGTAKEICEKAAIPPNTKPGEITNVMIERLIQGVKDTKIIAPPADCISPISSELLEKGLKKEIKAEFFCAITRQPSVYRGNPFVIEVAIAYGGELPADQPMEVLRFANRVPLLYQQGACAMNKAIIETNWRPYGLNQSQGNVPVGPVLILIHLASVWAPFTSEAKEAIAHYPEIIKEMKLALQEAGRQLGLYVNKKKRVQSEYKKRSYIEKYLPHIGIALRELMELSEIQERRLIDTLKEVLESSRQSIELESVENAGEEGLGLEFEEADEENSRE